MYGHRLTVPYWVCTYVIAVLDKHSPQSCGFIRLTSCQERITYVQWCEVSFGVGCELIPFFVGPYGKLEKQRSDEAPVSGKNDGSVYGSTINTRKRVAHPLFKFER